MIGIIDELVIDCQDPATLAKFWAGVVGGRAVDRDPDWSYVDPLNSSRLAFQRVPESKLGKNRLHLDIVVSDVGRATNAALRLGATTRGDLTTGPFGSFQVLLDPEGNEWCLVVPTRGK